MTSRISSPAWLRRWWWSHKLAWFRVSTSAGEVEGEIFSQGAANVHITAPDGQVTLAPVERIEDVSDLAGLLSGLGIPEAEAKRLADDLWETKRMESLLHPHF